MLRKLYLGIIVVTVLNLFVGIANTAEVSHWTFDEGHGTTAADSVGSNNGTLQGNTSWTAGKTGSYALNLDGSGDYVDCGNGSSLNLGTSNITIAAWVYLRSAPSNINPTIVSKWQDLGNRWYFHVIGSDMIQFTSRNDYGTRYELRTDHLLGLNQWYHVAFVGSSSPKIYINGQDSITSGSYSSSTLSNNATLKIGYNGYTDSPQYLDGMIDDVHIFNHALSQDEISALIPEPASALLFIVGACVLRLRRKRR